MSLNKDLYVIKVNNLYHGVIVGDQSLYVTSESFASPLKAANLTRQLKSKNKITPVGILNKKQQVPKTKFQTKMSKANKLYTEAEMDLMTNLRFREAWVILNPLGKYVKSMLKDNKVAEYSNIKENALIFKTYEEARMQQNTLNMVIRQGHSLRRFFIANK